MTPETVVPVLPLDLTARWIGLREVYRSQMLLGQQFPRELHVSVLFRRIYRRECLTNKQDCQHTDV